MKYFLSFCILQFAIYVSFAQKQPDYTSKSSRAIRLFENALKYLDDNNYNKAILFLKDAIKVDSNFIEAHFLVGDIYAQQDNLKDAIIEYQKGYLVNPNFFPTGYYTLGKYEIEYAVYEDAKKHFLKYLSFSTNNKEKRNDAERQIRNCIFAIEALKHPVPFEPINMGANVNSEFDDYFPSLTVDENKLLFTRNISSSYSLSGFQEDFFISEKNNGTWQKAINIGMPVNTDYNEGAPSISADGKLIFYAACEYVGSHGQCDIYYSRFIGNNWSKPINLGAPVNSFAWESQPSFSTDGRTLYFARGSGSPLQDEDRDIYVSTLTDSGWTAPEKIRGKINTPFKEELAYIHPDNQSIYFASSGHPGMGGLDIFISRKQSDGSWGEPVNLGYPINTVNDETGLIVEPKGNRAIYSSSRQGGSGKLDLYYFELLDSVRPNEVSYVKGKVYDSKTKQALEAKFEIIELSTGNTVVQAWSDKINGDFIVTLPSGKDYALNVSKEGYLFYSDHFSCKNPADKKDAYHLDISLSPAKAGEKVILKNIFFETGSFDLKTESFPELNKIIAFIKKNLSVTIEISGHTDNVGDDKSNQILSEKRAKSVYDFLLKSGIETNRLTFKGFGESKPIASNENESGRTQNRRTEFAITAVK
ncbi:MAG: OmpA family protein [Bacteroidia bacterium]